MTWRRASTTGRDGASLRLFDVPDTDPLEREVDWRALDELAFIYTATERGNHSGIRFAASRDDAQRWCESDVSRGVMLGTEWAYFWTSCATFLRAYPPPLVLTGLFDNREWDDRIAAAGVKKINLDELPGLLRPLGVRTEGQPTVLPLVLKGAADLAARREEEHQCASLTPTPCRTHGNPAATARSGS